MAREVYLECKVGEGFFKSEAFITIQGVEQNYQAFADKSNIKGNSIKIDIVQKYKKGYLVDLPVQDTFTSGPRVYVGADKIKTRN
jgi:hypothetical protein